MGDDELLGGTGAETRTRPLGIGVDTLYASGDCDGNPGCLVCSRPPSLYNTKMPERPPYPGRPAQPPGFTYLKYSPNGKRLLVAGCGNYARSFRTNDNGEPDMIPESHEDTYAVAAGVCISHLL
jgi:hypothetical protein